MISIGNCIRKIFVANTIKKCFQVQKFYNSKQCVSQSLKVTLVGAAGEIGQHLSLLLKLSPYINELHLYDLKCTLDMALDLNEIDSDCQAVGWNGCCDAKEAFKRASIVVVLATNKEAVMLEPSELFEENKEIMCEIASYYCQYCPNAFLAIATQPLNTLIPFLSEYLNIIGSYDPKKVFGIASLNEIRANKKAAEIQGLLPECVKINCVGGACEKTIFPILSQAKPCSEFHPDEISEIVHYIQKPRKTIPPMTAAQSIYRFTVSLLKAFSGDMNVIDTAYVRSNVRKGVRYLTNPLLLGPGGIEKNLGLPGMTVTEKKLMERTTDMLKCEIKMAETLLGVDNDKKGKKERKKFINDCLRRRGVPSCPEGVLDF